MMMSRSIRILTILSLMLGGGWLVHQYSMHYAQAEVFRSYSQPLEIAELRSLALKFKDRGYRSVVINGQPLNYRRAHWAGSLESLLDQLETQLNNRNEANVSPAFSHAGRDWFFIGRLPHSEQPESRGFMLKASRQESGTQVWVWDFGATSQPGLTTSSDMGLPEGVSSLPGSLQLFSFHDADWKQQESVAGYSAPGSVTDHVIHYDKMLTQTGFKPSHPAIEVTAGNKFLQYKNSTTEISITISPSENEPGQSIDIIQFRKQG